MHLVEKMIKGAIMAGCVDEKSDHGKRGCISSSGFKQPELTELNRDLGQGKRGQGQG